MPRYAVEAHYRRDDNDDWVGVVGCVDGVSLWYYAIDTAYDEADWNDGIIGPSKNRAEVESLCARINL